MCILVIEESPVGLLKVRLFVQYVNTNVMTKLTTQLRLRVSYDLEVRGGWFVG